MAVLFALACERPTTNLQPKPDADAKKQSSAKKVLEVEVAGLAFLLLLI
jgi:hypothetical protein